MIENLKEVELSEIGKKLNEVIDKLNGKPEIVFVPKEIGLLNVMGITAIRNPINQALCKFPNDKSFEVIQGNKNRILTDNFWLQKVISHEKNYLVKIYNDELNTGNNYYLEKVDKPEAGKVYFITFNGNVDVDIKNIYHYVIFLSDKTYCCWCKSEKEGYFAVCINNLKWEEQVDVDYYEVKKVMEELE